jgi:hypothetical protein
VNDRTVPRVGCKDSITDNRDLYVFGAVQGAGAILVDSDGIVRYTHSATTPTGSYDKQGVADAVDTYSRSHP